MIWFKLVRSYVLNAKVKVDDVIKVVDGLDVDKDGCISVGEIVNGIKKIL